MRELIRGLFVAGLALFIVLAGLNVALSEKVPDPPTATQLVQAPTETLFIPSPIVPTPIDIAVLFLTQTPPPPPTQCPVPPGWAPVTVASGDTLLGLAAQHGVSLALVLQVNCLITDSTYLGATVYLPRSAPTLPATAQCGPPLGWVFYTVQPGDTLSALSRRYGVLIYDLRQANCIPGIAITVGQNLYVPPIVVITNAIVVLSDTPTLTPTQTPPPQPSATLEPTLLVASPEPATLSPATTATPTPTATETETPTETATVLPSETPSETPTLPTP